MNKSNAMIHKKETLKVNDIINLIRYDRPITN